MAYQLGGQLLTGSGVAGSENTSIEVWTPAYQGYSAWNGDIALCNATGNAATATAWASRIYCPSAFSLTKLSYFITNANSVPTAQNATTLNQTSVDVTTLTGATTLTLAATTGFPAGGGSFVAATTTPTGLAFITYATVSGATVTGCKCWFGSTGTIANGGNITQSLNTMQVWNDAATTVLGYLDNQGANWGAAGLCGVAAAPQALSAFNGVSTTITAGSYVWVVQFATGTTAPTMLGFNTRPTAVNANIASAANYRIARNAGAGATTSPNTPNASGVGVPFAPGSLVSSNTNATPDPWFGLS